MGSVPLWVKLLGAIVALALVCVGLAFVPTSEVAYAPVDPVDLEGSISVDGSPVEPLQGRLYLVGVTQRKVNLLQRLLLDVGDPNVDFGPEPDDIGDDGASKDDVESMERAKEVAAALAFELAGKRVSWTGGGATVAGTVAGTPADGSLEAGDIILRINGRDVDNGVDAGKLINGLAPGSPLVLGVRRAGTAVRVRMRTVEPVAGDLEHTSRIGVQLDTLGLEVKLPKPVSIDSGNVVGPSAGLAFTLYLYDALDTSVDLLRGRYVVVSGSVAPDGRVREVGRIRQKAISAQLAHRDVLIVPIANEKEAQRAVADTCGDKGQCVRVIGVTSVRDAVEALRSTDTRGAASAA